MDEELFFDIMERPSEHGIPSPISTNVILQVYNEKATAPISRRQFIEYLSVNPDVHAKFIKTREQIMMARQIAVQMVEDKAWDMAMEGDKDMIKLCLTTQNKDFQSKTDITINTLIEFKNGIEEKKRALLDATPQVSYAKQSTDDDVIDVDLTTIPTGSDT